MNSIAKILGQNIERERSVRGLSQADLGQEVGVTGQTVYRWEKEKTWPTAQNVEDLAKFFGVPNWSLYMPHKPTKQSVKSTSDPKIRDALVTISRALGIAFPASKKPKS